jgi:RNA polymerase sigma-70 factor (ECF subfamily)
MGITGPTSAAKDRDLVQQCIDGDDRAMLTLYQQNKGRIYALALRMTGNASDADDVVQDTFLKAWRNLSRFRRESSFGTWLYRIAVNLCRDLAKRRQPTEEEVDGVAPYNSGDAIARKHLTQALASLPQGYREIVVLHDVLELGHPEIADILDVAVGTSKSQLHKARVELRRILNRSDGLTRQTGGRP